MTGTSGDSAHGTSAFFDLDKDPFAHRLLSEFGESWQIVEAIPALATLLTSSPRVAGTIMDGAWVNLDSVHLEPGAVVEPGAYVEGPTYLGPGVRIRQGAYVRGNCIFLAGSLLGHGSEAKSAVFLSGAKAAHFAYVGDSILGHSVNLGSGVTLSNLPFSPAGESRPVTISNERGVVASLRKFGAVIGDGSQLGARVVTNPGTFLGAESVVYPATVVPRGGYPPGSVLRSGNFTIEVESRVDYDQSGRG